MATTGDFALAIDIHAKPPPQQLVRAGRCGSGGRVVNYAAPIGCGSYLAGHDVHPIAMRATVDRPAVVGRLELADDHAAFMSEAGHRTELWTHDLATLRYLARASIGARLQVGEHLVWVDLLDDDNTVQLGCVNVAFAPVGPCAGTTSSPPVS